jgi:hypothetical protein
VRKADLGADRTTLSSPSLAGAGIVSPIWVRLVTRARVALRRRP